MMPRKTRWTEYPQSIEPLLSPEAARPRAVARPAPAEDQPFDDWRRLARRMRIPIAVFLVIMVAVLFRLAALRIGGGAAATADALPAPDVSRGRIVDRHGLLLATDNFTWELYADPQEIRKSSKRAALIASVAITVGQSVAALQTYLDLDTPQVTLARNLNETQRMEIQQLDQNLFWSAPVRTRAYPQGTLAAQLIGYTDRDQIGHYGVEASYQTWLRRSENWPGQLPGDPQPIAEAWKLYLPSPTGRDLALNLDAPLQHLVEKRLIEALIKYEAEAGTIIVMDPRTGAILALANYPTFDPNHYGDSESATWINPAVNLIYEPGSVFKLMTFAAALDTGLTTPDKTYYDDGALIIAGRRIRNATGNAYGEVTAAQALAKSLNVVTARLCLEMGPEVFYRYVRLFGFGRMTEVDLNLESAGIVNEPGSKEWSEFDQAANSFGQGISVTTLQMINAVAAIANGGKLLQPQIAQGFISDGQMRAIPPRVLNYPIKPETARTLTRMMVYTMDQSAYPHSVPGYRVAGKTGTAEIPTETGYTSQDTIASFVGFLPAADPQVVILVKLVKPQTNIWAEHVAVPVFGQVGQDAVRILKIQPDEREP
ncbi:MAG: penicillin-binding protein 2 [Chloroflexi bacterium]|nr:penicillin-binding protein 2 [Chloroflexota bacterium]